MATVDDLAIEIIHLKKTIHDLHIVLKKHIESDGRGFDYEKLLHLASPTTVDVFMKHLKIACSKIKEPSFPETAGRPRMKMQDIIFALTLMVHLNLSGRQMLPYINKSLEIGYISKHIAPNTLLDYLKDSKTTQCLQKLLHTGYTGDNKELLQILAEHINLELKKETRELEF